MASTKTTYADEIARLGLTPVAYNSNNAWGFGGMSGQCYELPGGAHILIGMASFRHITGEKVQKVVRPSVTEVIDGNRYVRQAFSPLFGQQGLDYLATLPTPEK